MDIRDFSKAKRIVIKLGTNVLRNESGEASLPRLYSYIEDISTLVKSGKEVLIITSGAVGFGRKKINVEKSDDIVLKQACAAIGQSKLMSIYENGFDSYGITIAQVLLTEDDFANRKRYLNLRNTLNRLLELGVVPIINQNDTVSTFELETLYTDALVSFADNDKLSALVASEMDADLLLILSDAFSVQKMAAGTLGATVMIGARRGLFSNEAGMGSAPNAAATAHTSHPVKQGYVQMFGVFVDTLLICSCTAFIVLLADYTQFSGMTGIALTQAALANEVGIFGHYFVSFSVLLFAFTSIIGNYYYGQANLEFWSRRRFVMAIFRSFVCVMVLSGAILELDLAWGLADLCMTLMALINIYAILRLRKQVCGALQDYRAQKAQGKNPVFHAKNVPEITQDTWWE